MNVHGQCHCGAVHLSAEVQPSRVFVCHCTDCQVLTGSALPWVDALEAVPACERQELLR